MTAAGLSLRRISAMILRHAFLMRHNWPRLFEMIYWPTLQLVIWGFITEFLATNSSWVASAFGVLLSAVLLWELMFRSQFNFALSFLEEVWSRNLGNLFITPLRANEFLTSLMIVSFLRTMIGIMAAALMAIPLYHFSIFTLGMPLIAFFGNLLVFGWVAGLFLVALVLRFGTGMEIYAWFMIVLLAPVSAVYYPVTVLPPWLQLVAWALPSTHVFEGMRQVLFEGRFDLTLFAGAVALNLLYLTMATLAFLLAFRSARKRGALLQMGD